MNLMEPTPSQLLLSADHDYVAIRGEHLPLDGLVDPRLFDEGHVAELRDRFRNAQPFEHLVIDNWFNPTLLKLAEEEFELFPSESWRGMNNKYETTLRSQPGSKLGPAATTYFNIVNSAWFLTLLSKITTVQDLVADPYLFGGGLHESRNGGRFGIHRDFDRHVRTGLQNEMVLLTYLNPAWRSEWNADLELWDGDKRQCVTSVMPLMGRSILLRHGERSYHGHPRPMAAPNSRVRRSLATYYYTNSLAVEQREKRVSSVFLFSDRTDYIRQVGKRWTPPALWDVLKRFVRR